MRQQSWEYLTTEHPPALPSHLELQEISSIKSSAVFHPMAETEVSTVKLQPGSSSWGSHWYSNIQCDWGSLGINPSHFLLFLQLRNKDVSLLLTAISAKHTGQPQSTTRRQKLQLNKSFIKTTRECVTNSGYDYCRYSSLSWLVSYLYTGTAVLLLCCCINSSIAFT